jgi:TonB family protein
MPAVQVSAAPAELPVQEVQVTASSSQSSSQPAGASSSTSTKEKEKEKETQSSKESKSSSSSNASEKKNGDSAEKSSDSANKPSEAQPKVIALAQTSEFRRPQGGDVAPPKITSSAALPTLLGANATPSLPSLSVPQPASSGPLKVSSAALSDRLIRRLEPQYPEIARRSGLGGAVRIRLEIGVDGKVKSATVLEGAPVLGAAARDAVLQWRYRPYVIDNRPVPIETEIIVRFTAR